jgi:hypothetical protein
MDLVYRLCIGCIAFYGLTNEELGSERMGFDCTSDNAEAVKNNFVRYKY